MSINQTYTESIGQGYQSYFDYITENYYSTPPPNYTFVLDHKDFKYTYTTNELGLREISVDSFLTKSESGFRILSFGDSFTEGVGASYENSWPRHLERKIQAQNINASIFNAGVNGSDPFFQYVIFRDKLTELNPDLVILTLNFSDISDFYFRRGMERFQDDGKVINRSGPWFEFIYKYSYISRFIIIDILRKKPQLFITEKEYEKVADEFIFSTIKLVEEFKKLLSKNGKVLVVIFPSPAEALNAKDKSNITLEGKLNKLLEQVYSENVDTLSLFPQYEALINSDNYYNYTFKNNGHFNSKGYEIMAEYIFETIHRDSLLTK